jgi:hypothetical protein
MNTWITALLSTTVDGSPIESGGQQHRDLRCQTQGDTRNRLQNSLIRRSTCMSRPSPDHRGLALVGCYDENQVTGNQGVDAPTMTRREDGDGRIH